MPDTAKDKLIAFLNRQDLTSQAIDAAFEASGRDIGRNLGVRLLESRSNLLREGRAGFRTLNDILKTPQIGRTRLRQMLDAAARGQLDSAGPHSVTYANGQADPELRELVGMIAAPWRVRNLNQAPVLAASKNGGIKGKIAEKVLEKVADKALEKGGELLDDALEGGDKPDTATGRSKSTYPCGTSVTVTVDGTGTASEDFWWNVEQHERDKWDPILKDKAKAKAEEAMEARMATMKDFECASPCKKFFNATYNNPTYSVAVVGWNFFTTVTWTCEITANVTWGCQQ